MKHPSFGKMPEGQRLERIKTSAQYKESFENLSDTPALAEDTTYPKVIWHALKGNKYKTPPKPIPIIKTTFETVTGVKPVITWFGHSSYLIQVKGLNILIDPVFSKRASFSQCIGPSAFPGAADYAITDLPKIDVVILSHDHYDHMDYDSILELKGKVKHFYTPLGVGEHLEHWGIDAADITELDWWENTTIMGGMKLTTTPARHFSGRGLTRNKTLWASYVLNTGDYNLYLGGDSGYDTHFKQIGDKFGPFDLVILENGQYDAKWPYIHMTPEQTVQASIDLQAKVLFPVHWGKFALAVHGWNEPIIRVSKKAEEMNVQLTTPMLGEQIIVDSLYPSSKWWNF